MVKPQWEIEVVTRMPLDRWDEPLVDSAGRVPHTIRLEDAPAYVVPIEFDASCQDDPDLRVDVELEVAVSTSDGAVVREVRLTPRRRDRVNSRWPLTREPEFERIGLIEKLPVPRLLRDALAHAAMPAARPHIDEMGHHAEELVRLLPVKRVQRISQRDRELFRNHYAEALANGDLTTKLEQLTWTWVRLHAIDPARWASIDDLAGLQREADNQLTLAGGLDSFTLQEGSYTLPADWPPRG